MNLINTSLLNGIAVIVRILTMLGLNKVLAIYVGPAGYAAIGSLQNAVQIITTVGSGAITTGVVKYTAEYHDNEEQQARLWRTAGTVSLLMSIVIGILLSLFSGSISSAFFKDDGYQSIFIIFSISLIFFVFNTLLVSILNGKKEIHKYVVVNIVGSLVSLGVTSISAVNFGIYGALVSLVVHPSLSFFVTVYLCWKSSWFKWRYLFGSVDKQILLNLTKFGAMAFTSAACVPLSHIFIRNYLGDNYGWNAAGYWEAMWRLSAAYLMFITSTLAVYYLPRLSELKDPEAIKKEIINGYKLILPATIVFSFLIYALRDFIINLLFSSEFCPMRDLFAWQVVGDSLKVGSWLLAYLMLSKAMVKIFIITEIVFACNFVGLVYLLTSLFGFEGVSMAHCINYALYWIVMIFAVGKTIFKENY